MLLTIFLMVMISLATSQNTPSNDTYLLAKLIPVLNPADNYMFDGPSDILNATTSTNTTMPTLKQMMYYNYYAASMYCQYQLQNLSCVFCKKFKGDVDAYRVIMNNDTDLTALVTLSNKRKEIVVTYRGTAELWNVVLDAELVDINIDDNIKIHKGYLNATMSLYDDVVKSIGYLRSISSNYLVVLVGHSLGGCMARITEFFLVYLNQFPGCEYAVYTYGEPRVGNEAFVDFMNSQNITTARTVNRADIFPHTPPTSIANTTFLYDYYIQTLTEYWINEEEGGPRFCNRNVYEDCTCSNSMGPAYSVLDHVNYFDVDYELCFLQAAQFLAVPAVFQPVGTVPPLPERITDVFALGALFVANDLGPVLGR